MYLRIGLLLALVGASPGCMKMSAGSYAPAYEESYAEGEAVYDFEDDTVAVSAEADNSRSFKSRRSRMRNADAAPMGPGAMGGAEAPAPPPEPEPGVETPQEPKDEDPTDSERHIIYTATMQVAVFNLEDALLRAESLPEAHGGYVQNMSTSYLVMRIPSAELRPVMEELATLGIVENRTLDAQDVTEEYLDIETRIAVLQSTQSQLIELLAKATTVKEALEVRKALDAITMELEVLKGRLRRLGNLVSFSTLTLNLIERGPHTAMPSSNDPFPWVNSLGVEGTEWK